MKPVVAIKYIGNGWNIRLENHELEKSAWAINGEGAYGKAKIIADYIGCNIEWRSKYDSEGNIVQYLNQNRRTSHGKINTVA